MVESQMSEASNQKSENKKSITTEGWKKVEEALSGYVGSVEMLVDGYNITFIRCRINKNSLAIVTHINGKVDIGWCSASEENKHPERKYLRHSLRYVWSNKTRQMFKKWSKKQLKKSGYNPDERRSVCDLIWSSASTIKRHYKKTFSEIILLKINGQVVDENGKSQEAAQTE